MSTIYIDTHIAVWLYGGFTELLTNSAVEKIESSTILLSAMVLLELRYLFIRNKIATEPVVVVGYLASQLAIGICPLPFSSVIQEAMTLDWTRDPFDRLITANAQANGFAGLVTADLTIRQNYPQAIW